LEKQQCEVAEEKIGWGAYAALIGGAVFLSGIFSRRTDWLRFFDFTTLLGTHGRITVEAARFTFRGTGGTGAREGFMFSLELMPAVMLALGVVGLIEGLGGLAAARKLLTPLLRPVLGIPGAAGLALITNLQSSDAGAGMTKELYQAGHITDNERTIFAMYQISGSGQITNYFGTGAALFGFYVGVPIILPFLVIIAFKIFGANMIRLYIRMASQKGAASTRTSAAG
jgi:nucleoside recognition membrane protein YjiH